MTIPPVYLVSGLTGLTVLLLVLRRGLQQTDDSQFVEMATQSSPPPVTKKLPKLVSIYLVPKSPILGADLLSFLLANDLQYSNQKIFYLPGEQGERLFVATLSSPGTFEIKTMASETFSGLSFFIQPNISHSPLEDFDALCSLIFTAKDLFDATLQSTDQKEISLDALRELRETIAA